MSQEIQINLKLEIYSDELKEGLTFSSQARRFCVEYPLDTEAVKELGLIFDVLAGAISSVLEKHTTNK